MTMLQLKKNVLEFAFPEIHPNAVLEVEFQRTLRIPDDGKTYPLPPGLGQFPVKHTDDYKDRIPAKWAERGGVMVPTYQAEALWIKFNAKNIPNRKGIRGYVFAVRVAAGKINAVSGESWTVMVKDGDHMVVPPQPWLDGFCVEKGKIRQFMAMPLGWGMTVEHQVTGQEEHGGIQIEVIPMKVEEFDKRFPKYEPAEVKTSGGVLRSCSFDAVAVAVASAAGLDFMTIDLERSVTADMGLGAGGQMKQEICVDTYGLEAWDVSKRQRTFVHLANSFAWEAITGHSPPPSPCTPQNYARQGLPWYEHYMDGMPIQSGGENLKTIKSVLALGFQKGIGVFPNNASVEIPPEKIVTYKAEKPKDAVRDGSW
jgi:hypothetical protein